ncbi:MAG: peptidylprolyl isomerase [Nitrospinales bacterium]
MYTIRYLSVPFFIFAVLLLLVTCTTENTEKSVVATVGKNFKITFTELEKHYSKKFNYAKKYETKEDDFSSSLADLVHNRLKILESYAQKLEQDSVVIKDIEIYTNNELFNRYMWDKCYSKYITDEEMQASYKNRSKEITFRQIVINRGENDQSRKDALEKMKHVYDEVKKGTPFDQLAMSYSDDAESAKNGGLTRPLKYKDVKDRIDKAIFEMNGGISSIFEIKQALYLFKIEKINYHEIEPFEQIKEEIIQELTNRYQSDLIPTVLGEFNSCLDTTGLQWNIESLTKFNNWSVAYNFNPDLYLKQLNVHIADGMNDEIFTYMDKKFYLSDLARFVSEYSFGINISGELESLQEEIKTLMMKDCIVKKAIASGYDENVLQAESVKGPLEKALIKRFDDKIIKGQIPEQSETNLKQFYSENKEDFYFQSAFSRIKVVIVSDKTQAQHMWETIKNGGQLSDIPKAKTVQSYERDRDGNLRIVKGDGHIKIGERALKLKKGGMAGPIEFTDPEKGTRYAIIQCNDAKPEKQLTYQEVKDKVVRDYQKHHFEIIEKKMMDRLRKKYGVKTFQSVLRNGVSSYFDKQSENSL